ncbi:MAG: hypothetical protein LUQ66_11615 [Methanoregula sp.]|nr:hypothetical protein [Methanoregula sp.]
MRPMIRSLLCGCILLLLIVLPAAASPILSSESFTPNPPLTPGGPQQVVATFAIPSGTTFPRNHELQMQTGLVDARWNIQVILDGNNAAQQTASGSTAFINGEILSYSVNRDVRFTVTVSGTVPASATGPVTVLQLVELDNAGSPVPGSQIVISQPVAGAAVSSSVSEVPTLTPPLVTTSLPVTKSPGFSVAIGILGCALAGLVWMRRRQ